MKGLQLPNGNPQENDQLKKEIKDIKDNQKVSRKECSANN